MNIKSNTTPFPDFTKEGYKHLSKHFNNLFILWDEYAKTEYATEIKNKSKTQ